MARAFPIARLCGIRLDVHASWLAIYALVTVTLAGTAPLAELGTPRSVGLAALAGIVLFGSVVLHELAHALTARRFGVRTRAISLFFFGGVATLESEPPHPRADATIALAGPLASAALAGAAFAAMHAAALLPPRGAHVAILLLAYATVANAGLAAFNLVPAYPMDGGRVLRALWWRVRGDRDVATGGASLVGAALACCFAGAGLAGIALTRSWQFAWYVVIGVFLLRQALQGRPLARFPANPSEP
jgi:Zn-dependent protease